MNENAIETKPYGTLLIKLIEGAADAQSVIVRPDAGKVWLVIDGYGTHNAAVNQSCYWEYYDGTNLMSKTPVSIASGVQLELSRNTGAFHSVIGPMVLTRDSYLRFSDGTDIGALEKLYARLLVLEYGE